MLVACRLMLLSHRYLSVVYCPCDNLSQGFYNNLDASLNVPKLYEGKEIQKLVACGLKLEPLHQGFKPIEKYLSTLGA